MQQVNSYVPPPSQLPAIIALVISSLALLLSVFSLYLQRRDKKPRLNLRIETNDKNIDLGNRDEGGFPMEELTTVLVIHAANPTDKQINIESIQFQPKDYAAITVPLSRTITSIPPHEKRHAIVVVSQFQQALGVANSGHFILIDALGYHHKTKSMVI